MKKPKLGHAHRGLNMQLQFYGLFLKKRILFLFFVLFYSCRPQPVKDSLTTLELKSIHHKEHENKFTKNLISPDLTFEVVSRDETEGYYTSKTRGPRYLVVRLKNNEQTTINGLLLRYDEHHLTRITDPELISPIYPSCETDKTFSLRPGAECLLLFTSPMLIHNGISRVELIIDGERTDTVPMYTGQSLYVVGDFTDPDNPLRRGLAVYERVFHHSPLNLEGIGRTLASDHLWRVYAANERTDGLSTLWLLNGGTSTKPMITTTSGQIKSLVATQEGIYMGGNFQLTNGTKLLAKAYPYQDVSPDRWQWQELGANTALGDTTTIRGLTPVVWLRTQINSVITTPIKTKYHLPTEEDTVYGTIKTPLVKIFSVSNASEETIYDLSAHLSLDGGSKPSLALTNDPRFYDTRKPICTLGGTFSLKAGEVCLLVVQGKPPKYSEIGDKDFASLTLSYHNNLIKVFDLQRINYLYAGGDFTHRGDSGNAVPLPYIARFDGMDWSTLGEEPPQFSSGTSVKALATDSWGGLYIGGNFSVKSESLQTENIVIWQGEGLWSSPGKEGGLNQEVLSLVPYNVNGFEYILASGRFTDVAGIQNNQLWKIAKYNPLENQWNSVGNFLTNHPSEDAVHSTLTGIQGAEIYAVGHFDQVSGQATNHGAKFDGTAWRPWSLGEVQSMNTMPPTYYTLAGVNYNLSSGGTSHIQAAGVFQEASVFPYSSPGFVTMDRGNRFSGPVALLPWENNNIYTMLMYWTQSNNPTSSILKTIIGGDFKQVNLRSVKGSSYNTHYVPSLTSWSAEVRQNGSWVYPYCYGALCYSTTERPTPTDLVGNVYSLLRIADLSQPHEDGTIYVGGDLQNQKNTSYGVAQWRPADNSGSTKPVGSGLSGGSVRALTSGHGIEVKDSGELFWGLSVEPVPRPDAYGYYIGGLTDGPAFQVFRIYNTNAEASVEIQIDLLPNDGLVKIETDAKYGNGRSICPLNTIFTLKSKRECVVVLHADSQASYLGTESYSLKVNSKEGLNLFEATVFYEGRLAVGGDFTSVHSNDQTTSTLHTALFDGKNWQALSLPLGYTLESNTESTVYHLTTRPMGQLVVSGNYKVFDSQGNIAFQSATVWDLEALGTKERWHDLSRSKGKGIQNGSVFTSQTIGEVTYHGGQFSALDSREWGHENLAATFGLSDPTWFNVCGLGFTPSGTIHALASIYEETTSPSLYVGGDFTYVGPNYPYLVRCDLDSKMSFSVGTKFLNGPVYQMVLTPMLSDRYPFYADQKDLPINRN